MLEGETLVGGQRGCFQQGQRVVFPQRPFGGVDSHQTLVAARLEVELHHQLLLHHEGVQVVRPLLLCPLNDCQLPLAIVAHGAFHRAHVVQRRLRLGILDGQPPRLARAGVELSQCGQQPTGGTGRGMAPFEVGVSLRLRLHVGPADGLIGPAEIAGLRLPHGQHHRADTVAVALSHQQRFAAGLLGPGAVQLIQPQRGIGADGFVSAGQRRL